MKVTWSVLKFEYKCKLSSVNYLGKLNESLSQLFCCSIIFLDLFSLQVVCGSKYIVRGESPRDHVDLLTSSRHWPPVYVVDMATSVALCADICYPDLTAQMWGRNQGCFSDPMESLRVSFSED